MTEPGRPPGALAGVRVIDLTRVLAGPFCTQLLADMGADVVKIEGPDGDLMRRTGTVREGLSWYFAQFNRNKRSVVLDLYGEPGRAALADLLRSADVLVENYRPGVLARMGFGPDRIEAINPRLIVASVNGYGSTGPYAERPSFDFIAQAMSGFMAASGAPDGEPMRSGPPIGDLVAGLYAAFGVVCALHARGAGTGMGAADGKADAGPGTGTGTGTGTGGRLRTVRRNQPDGWPRQHARVRERGVLRDRPSPRSERQRPPHRHPLRPLRGERRAHRGGPAGRGVRPPLSPGDRARVAPRPARVRDQRGTPRTAPGARRRDQRTDPDAVRRLVDRTAQRGRLPLRPGDGRARGVRRPAGARPGPRPRRAAPGRGDGPHDRVPGQVLRDPLRGLPSRAAARRAHRGGCWPSSATGRNGSPPSPTRRRERIERLLPHRRPVDRRERWDHADAPAGRRQAHPCADPEGETDAR